MKCSRRKFLKAGLLYVPSVALSQNVIFSPIYDPPTIDWANRVKLNGGAAPSANTLTALTEFSRQIRDLRPRIYHLNVVAPDNIIAFRTPFIVGVGIDPWVRHQVLSPDPTADQLNSFGWQGFSAGAQGYVYDCGVKPSAVTAFNSGNAGMSVYMNNLTANGNMAAGCYTAGTIDPQFGIVPWQDATNNYNFYSYTSPLAIVSSAGLPANSAGRSGLYVGSLSSTTRADLYFANSTVAWFSLGNNTGTHSTSPPSDSTVGVGGSHQGSNYNLLNSCISFFALHDGFSSSDGKIFFNAVQRMRTNFGTGFA